MFYKILFLIINLWFYNVLNFLKEMLQEVKLIYKTQWIDTLLLAEKVGTN